jgi:hypothetical protein
MAKNLGNGKHGKGKSNHLRGSFSILTDNNNNREPKKSIPNAFQMKSQVLKYYISRPIFWGKVLLPFYNETEGVKFTIFIPLYIQLDFYYTYILLYKHVLYIYCSLIIIIILWMDN